MEPERWVDVLGYEGVYTVSDLGRVRLMVERKGGRQACILAQTPDEDGYLCVHLNGYGLVEKPRARTARVAKIVYESFNGPIPTGLQIDHVNGTKIDNRLGNLEPVTCAVNIQRMVARGGRSGELNGATSLRENDVIRIRERAATGETFAAIAASYKLSIVAVSNIARGRYWKHVGGPIATSRKGGRPPKQ